MAQKDNVSNDQANFAWFTTTRGVYHKHKKDGYTGWFATADITFDNNKSTF